MEINDKLALLADTLDVRFTLNDKPISHKEVFEYNGLLPAIARRADQLCSLCLGYGLGVTFEESESAILGVQVAFDDVTPDSLRLLCVLDVLYELMQASPTPGVTSLDELMYD